MPNANVNCTLNGTSVPALEVLQHQIICPMVIGNRDAAIGRVKFGVKIEDSYTDLGDFHYYKQVELDSITPRFGPAQGNGLIYIAGKYFTSDFPNAEVGCKIGESIGKGIVVDE